MRTRSRPGLLWGVYACALAAVAVLCPATGRAYESVDRFLDPPRDGGGGGRLFTGVPRDGFNCRLCHRGQPDYFGLRISGVPEDGYVSGQTYTITVSWNDFEDYANQVAATPETAFDPVMAVEVELGSESRSDGIGAIALQTERDIAEEALEEQGASDPDAEPTTSGSEEAPPSADEATEAELPQSPRICQRGPLANRRASQLHKLAGAEHSSGLLRCSSLTPRERCIINVRDCGASELSFDWVAPPGNEPIWFSFSMVSSIKRSEDPTDDAVFTQVVPVQSVLSRASAYEQVLKGQCAVGDAPGGPGWRPFLVWALAFMGIGASRWRRRRRNT